MDSDVHRVRSREYGERHPHPRDPRGLRDSARGNKPTRIAVEYNMAVRSRWFPLILGVLQTLLYFGLLGYDYWHGARDQKLFNIREFIRQDLTRPLFEPSGWCGAYTVLGFGQSAVMGIDLPAVVGASFLLAVVNGKPACLESLITPRGQMITAAFVPVLWFMLGTSIRRLAQRHWHKQAGRRLRALLAVGLVALPLGVICLAFSVVAFFSESSLSVRLAGFAFWLIYIAALVAERLRVGPFRLVREPVRA